MPLMRTYPVCTFQRCLRIVISAILIAHLFGCTKTVRMESCERWAYRGSSDASPEHNYRIEITTYLCGSKCGCLTDEELIRCEDGWESYCFRECTRLWEVECSKWMETTASFDFITGNEIKKGSGVGKGP